MWDFLRSFLRCQLPYMSLLEATIRERRGSGRIGMYLRSTCGNVNLLRVEWSLIIKTSSWMTMNRTQQNIHNLKIDHNVYHKRSSHLSSSWYGTFWSIISLSWGWFVAHKTCGLYVEMRLQQSSHQIQVDREFRNRYSSSERTCCPSLGPLPHVCSHWCYYYWSQLYLWDLQIVFDQYPTS